MSSNIEVLDKIHAKGLAAAQAHFDALVACIHSVLPDGVKDTIPKTLGDVAGLFSASTKEFYLVILHDKPGYESMNAVFCYKSGEDFATPGYVGWREVHPCWYLKKFCVMIGGDGLFQAPKEYTANCIEDALVLSKQIAKYRDKYTAENPAISSFPDLATAKPN